MSKVEKNWFEWCVFAVGLMLVAGALVYLAYTGATMGDAPPTLEVRLGSPEPQAQSFIIPVTVVNHGDQTAEGVTVEVVMESDGEEPARGEFTIAYLPRHATRAGWVMFDRDPRAARLQARVLGYEQP